MRTKNQKEMARIIVDITKQFDVTYDHYSMEYIGTVPNHFVEFWGKTKAEVWKKFVDWHLTIAIKSAIDDGFATIMVNTYNQNAGNVSPQAVGLK